MKTYEPEPIPCINHKHCGGYAVPGRAKCECCLAADEEEKAERDVTKLNNMTKKPHSLKDVWRWK